MTSSRRRTHWQQNSTAPTAKSDTARHWIATLGVRPDTVGLSFRSSSKWSISQWQLSASLRRLYTLEAQDLYAVRRFILLWLLVDTTFKIIEDDWCTALSISSHSIKVLCLLLKFLLEKRNQLFFNFFLGVSWFIFLDDSKTVLCDVAQQKVLWMIISNV